MNPRRAWRVAWHAARLPIPQARTGVGEKAEALLEVADRQLKIRREVEEREAQRQATVEWFWRCAKLLDF